MFLDGVGSFLGGIFGDSGAPYDEAMKQYRKYADMASGYQMPYINAGKDAIPGFTSWLNTMKDPSSFINNMMNSYKESPWAKFQKQQAMDSLINSSSATGLMGSSPMQNQAQLNASNISNQDMQDWLSKVLGINSQYGAGQQYLVDRGSSGANALTQLFGNMGQMMGEGAYGRQAGRDQDFWNAVGGGLSLLF